MQNLRLFDLICFSFFLSQRLNLQIGRCHIAPNLLVIQSYWIKTTKKYKIQLTNSLKPKSECSKIPKTCWTCQSEARLSISIIGGLYQKVGIFAILPVALLSVYILIRVIIDNLLTYIVLTFNFLDFWSTTFSKRFRSFLDNFLGLARQSSKFLDITFLLRLGSTSASFSWLSVSLDPTKFRSIS